MIRPIRMLVAALALVVSASALASTVLALSVEEMTRRSDVVVRAQVVSQSSRREKGRLYTFTTLEVRETWKGRPEETIVVRQLGGVEGELATYVAGDARLEPGEEVVVFLRRNPAGEPVYHFVGLAQAKFRIERRDGTPVARRELGGLAVVDPATGRIDAERKARLPREFELDVLRRLVRGVR